MPTNAKLSSRLTRAPPVSTTNRHSRGRSAGVHGSSMTFSSLENDGQVRRLTKFARRRTQLDAQNCLAWGSGLGDSDRVVIEDASAMLLDFVAGTKLLPFLVPG